MKRVIAVMGLILAISAFATPVPRGGVPTFWQKACPPTNPQCQAGATATPPPVVVDPNAPQACRPNDETCIKQYTQEQTENYQSGVSNPSFVNPVTGGGGCVLSQSGSCASATQNWNSKTVQPIQKREVPYSVGERPEFKQQPCQQVYSPFSRTTTTDCNGPGQ